MQEVSFRIFTNGHQSVSEVFDRQADYIEDSDDGDGIMSITGYKKVMRDAPPANGPKISRYLSIGDEGEVIWSIRLRSHNLVLLEIYDIDADGKRIPFPQPEGEKSPPTPAWRVVNANEKFDTPAIWVLAYGDSVDVHYSGTVDKQEVEDEAAWRNSNNVVPADEDLMDLQEVLAHPGVVPSDAPLKKAVAKKAVKAPTGKRRLAGR